MTEPTIFELSSPGRQGVSRSPNSDVPETALPEQFRAERNCPCPKWQSWMSSVISPTYRNINYAVDIGFYPLGSCTMKYNPKANEAGARLARFCLHPSLCSPLKRSRVTLGSCMGCKQWLKEIGWLCRHLHAGCRRRTG